MPATKAMQHVSITAWRPARCCIQKGKTTTDFLGLRQAFSVLAKPQQRPIRSCDAFLTTSERTSQLAKQKRSPSSYKYFFTTRAHSFQKISSSQQQTPSRAPSELAFRRDDLRPYETKVVFGSNGPSVALANTLLRVLHSRRVNGTLDLDLPKKLTTQLKSYPAAVDDALHWLRLNYPIDEDAAILRRIDREEAGEGDEALIHRAESLGLYKPQSGVYGAKLGEEGDIFGESQLQKLRKENELRAEQEQKELHEFIEQKQQAKEEKAGALETRREDGLEVSSGSRPPNTYEKWKLRHYLAGTSRTTHEEAAQTGKLRRLLPSFVFAAAVTYVSYLFAATWTPPDRATRLWPSEPLSRATIYGICLINIGIFLLWRLPPAWRILNRYFIVSHGVPRPLSNLGNIWSHQTLGHLGTNMLLLWLIGTSLHEQIGRGDFLALYVSSGVVGSVASLTNMALRNVLYSSSLGASGAVIGIFAAYCTINPDTTIRFWLLPGDLAEKLSCKASTFLTLAIAFEILSMTVPFMNRRSIDYVAHLSGYAMGILGGWMWKRDHGGGGTVGSLGGTRHKEPRWYERILGR